MNPDPRKSGLAKPRPILPPLDEKQRYTLAEAALYLRSSLWSVHRDIREGLLTAIRDRSRTYIHGSEIVRRSRLGADFPTPGTSP